MDGGGARALGRRAALVLAVVLPAALLAALGYSRRWIGDDGFINLRVVSQLLAGNGFVYNAGDRSEAVTSPAWVALLWLAGALGARLEDAAWLIGLVLSVAGVACSACAPLLVLSPQQRRESWFLPFGMLAYVSLPAAWDYATSGLENGLGLAFLGGCACLVARARAPGATPRSAAGAAFALSFAVLIRPDCELLVAPWLASVCLLARGWRRLALAVLGCSAGLAYQIFRMGYFASVVPNTALAKRAFEFSAEQGWHYLWNTLGVYWLLVPLVVAALTFAWEHRWRAPDWLSTPSCWIAGGLLHIAYIVSMGGDFMHARLLLPGLFALFSAVPLLRLEPIAARSRRGAFVLAAGVLYVWCAVCSLRLRVATKNEFGIGDERGWYARMAMVPHPTRIEHYAQFYFYRDAVRLRARVESRCNAEQCVRSLFTRKEDGKLLYEKPSAELPLADDISEYAVAAVAYRPLGIASAVLGTRIHVVDYYGLADPIAARLMVVQHYRAGHDKAFDTAWQAARYARFDSIDDPRAVAAHNALNCGLLGQFNGATRGPLSAGRFLRNIALAVRTSGLEISPDPFEAERQFCDP
jgi:arabinofuranosyltransferase